MSPRPHRPNEVGRVERRRRCSLDGAGFAYPQYTSELQVFVRKSLGEKAEGTFLWVALVCKELSKVRRQKAKSLLEKTSSGLKPLYGRILNQILHQKDQGDIELCRRILYLVTLTFRPLHLGEIAVFARIPELELKYLVSHCGSFITVREEIAYLVH